jgi:riboflavin kinase/FMN adenylyltransferase
MAPRSVDNEKRCPPYGMFCILRVRRLCMSRLAPYPASAAVRIIGHFSIKTSAMQLVRGLHNLRPQHRGCVATIGNFDGVHRGHQAILKRLRERAAELCLPSCVVIFEPQPREFFTPDRAPARLARLRDKLELLAAEGVDRVLCLAFNRRLRELSASDFVQQVLVDGLGVKHLEVGDDFRFGCDRAGDFAFLQRAGQRDGFSVESAETIELDGERISSTRVREALASGDFALAERLLGRPYSIAGRVMHGQKLGRQLGAPTANVQLKRSRIPLQGVYLVSALIQEQRVPGVANIGMRPTVQGDGRAHLEVHLLDYAGDLYGQRISVAFHHKLREELRFSSLEDLKTAIDADIAAARAYWLGQPHP